MLNGSLARLPRRVAPSTCSSLVNLVAVAVAGTYGASHVAGRRTAWPRQQPACFLSGLAVLAVVYLGPLAAWSHTFFWVHMTQHLLVMMVAAPLLVLGAPTTLWFRASRTRADVGGSSRFCAARSFACSRIRSSPGCCSPGCCSARTSRRSTTGPSRTMTPTTFIEQPLYSIAALLVLLPVDRRATCSRVARATPTRLVSLATMMIPEAIVGAVIYFASVDPLPRLRPRSTVRSGSDAGPAAVRCADVGTRDGRRLVLADGRPQRSGSP